MKPAGGPAPKTLILHASTVAFGPRRGVLILGPSGSGKSTLALQLMALGAALVVDDRTIVTRQDDALTATAPEATIGLIEARGVGLLQVSALPQVQLALAIDLGQLETERLPSPRTASWLGCNLPLLHKVEGGHFPAAILYYVLGKSDPAP